MLTTNLRTHYLILRDGRQFPITTEQYDKIRTGRKMKAEQKKLSDTFELCDADTKQLLYEGEYRAIMEFRETSKKNSSIRWYYCEYGKLHPMQDSCECFERCGIPAIIFREKARELYAKFDIVDRVVNGKPTKVKHYHPLYMQDLTQSQKNNIVALC